MHLILESIPSPSQGVWHLGIFPIRAYALCIIAGIFAAVWLTQKRWTQRGGKSGEIADMALLIVPLGIIGGRIYHVITDHELYFGSGAPNPWYHIFFIWDGGLGIWGAIALPAICAIWVCHGRGVRVSSFADAIAPALLVAQGIGRWGNYFNQELFGRPTTLPWGLEISPEHWPAGHTYPVGTTFHPTFLYESIWDLGASGVVLWLDRKFKLGYGRCFALYVMCYTAGRFWIEYLRIDAAAGGGTFLGLRFNDWTAIVCFLGGLVYFVLAGRKHRAPDTRPESVYLTPSEALGMANRVGAPGAIQPLTFRVGASRGVCLRLVVAHLSIWSALLALATVGGLFGDWPTEHWMWFWPGSAAVEVLLSSTQLAYWHWRYGRRSYEVDAVGIRVRVGSDVTSEWRWDEIEAARISGRYSWIDLVFRRSSVSLPRLEVDVNGDTVAAKPILVWGSDASRANAQLQGSCNEFGSMADRHSSHEHLGRD